MTQDSSVETPAGDRWRILSFSVFAWTVTNLDQSLFGYAVPGIMEEFQVGLSTIGFILAISFTLAAVLVSIAGFAADHFGRRKTLVVLLAVSALCVAMHSFVATVAALTIWRALAFGLSGGLAPVTSAYVSEAAPRRYRGMLMGVLQCGYPLGWFAASLIAAPLLESHGWRSIFLVGFAIIPVAFLIGWMLPESRRFTAARERDAAAGPGAKVDKGALAQLFGPELRRRSIASIVMFFAFGCAYAGTAFYFPTYFTQVRGYTPADATYLVGMSNGISIIGYLGAAYVGEYWMTRRNTAALWCVLGAIALMAMLWLPTLHWHDKVLFAITTTFFYGGNAVIATLLAELFPTRIRTTAIAVCGSAPLSLGFAFYPMVVPLAVGAFGWQVALSFMIAPLLLITAIAALMLPNLRSGTEVPA